MATATGRLAHPATRRRFASPVLPGSGWPGDAATPATPVALDAAGVAALAAAACAPDGGGLEELTAASSVCRACPRLVAWREDVALTKRRAFADEPYWGRPIPGWGDDEPWLLVLGLAPAAHGGNRTGRIFTGDRSGDWIFAALHRAGLATQATSVDAADGQRLVGARMVAAVRCAPPDNKPLPAERDACAGWLDAELRLTAPSVRVVLALGGFAWDAALRAGRRLGRAVDVPAARFGHGAVTRLGDVPLVGSYHVSQQNTFTGRLTEAMLDDVLALCRRLGHIGL